MELGFLKFFPFHFRFVPRRGLGKLGTTWVGCSRWVSDDHRLIRPSCSGFKGQRMISVRAFRGMIWRSRGWFW